ncbi:helix-turn-helix domain-containing protein [Dietzia aurantiaca]|uniref:helix-turn-helix transcriptional regulator n=1 Tax=Dietzia aurantiaca TaxID=983873 RepID=UPI001E55E2C9|nr:helix-turn-helix domain-containing protein [Dietzia aurantiaca]MCD2262454.1 helix-turn-helix domain-containing protein [Dietzia aurantiaca]
MNRKGLLDPPTVAEDFGVTVQRLAEWRHKGIGPSYVKVGRLIRYRAEDIDAWLDANTVKTGDAA